MEVVLYLVAGLVFLAFGAIAGLAYLASQGVSFGRSAFSLAWFIMVLLGVGMLAPGLQSLWRAYASRSWPTTRGVVVFADKRSETALLQDSQGSARRATTHGVALAYEYEVNGKKHFSNLRRFGQITASSKAWANDIIARYPAGADVPVWYCPVDPDLAVLEPGIGQEAYYLPGAGAAFFLFGLLAWFLSCKRTSS